MPWAVIFAYRSVTPDLDRVPGFVWVILMTHFALFQTFLITMWLQYTQHGGYYTGKRIYCTLSLVAA